MNKKVVDIVSSKRQKMNVIVICSSKQQIKTLRTLLGGDEVVVFCAGDSFIAGTVLNKLKDLKTQERRVLLMTSDSALGFNFFKECCHVVLAEEPGSYTDYLQLLARSDRSSPEALKVGSLITTRDVDQNSLELGLFHKSIHSSLVAKDHVESAKSIQKMLDNKV